MRVQRHRCALIISVFLLTSLTMTGISTAQVGPQDAVVHMLVFYAESCPHCQVVVNEFLPALKAKYGSQIDYILLEISNPANLQALIAIERAYGVPSERTTIPEIFIARDVFLGADAILQDLEATVVGYLKKGGAELTPPMKQALAAASPKKPAVVRAVLFHMPTCSHCQKVIQEVLPLVKQIYGDQFVVKLIDVDSDPAYEAFSNFIQLLTGSKELVGVPTMVISDTVLLGSAQIITNIEATIAKYLAKGGADYPALPEGLDGPEYQLPAESSAIARPTATPTQTATPTPVAGKGAPTINLAYFHQPGCQECDRVQLALKYLQGRYPQLEITSFDVKEYAALNEWMGARAGVPEKKRLTAPAIFVGQDALVGENIYLNDLEALLEKYAKSGAPKFWEEFQGEEATEDIIQRFRSLGILTVIGAGLLDGLNPCAFATLIFFISYLALSGRKGREVLITGLAFTLGVFLTYLGVGLGLWKALEKVEGLAAVGRWFYIITAILCVILALLSFGDFLKARRGQGERMTLSLPRVLRRPINAIIRKGQSMRGYVAIAFLTGIAISIIELACTGQVYLPTIIFVLSVPSLRLGAFLYLVLYNLCFIIPLIVVFLVVYYGTTSLQLTRFLRAHTATIKLGTTVLFLVLAGWLMYTLL